MAAQTPVRNVEISCQDYGDSSKKLGGYTVIEVLIVLAITTLILLIVFLVVPTVQRNARNHSRKVVVNYVAAQLEEYKNVHQHYPGEGGAHNGSNYVEMCDFASNYVADYFGSSLACSPTISNPGAGLDDRNCVYTEGRTNFSLCFRYRPTTNHHATGDYDDIYVMVGHWCNRGDHYKAADAGAPVTSEYGGDGVTASLRAYVVYTPLESLTPYCVDSDISSF